MLVEITSTSSLPPSKIVFQQFFPRYVLLLFKRLRHFSCLITYSILQADKTTRYLMCHLRQSWGEFLSSQDLSFIDKQVHALDPHWLINMNTLDSPESHSVKILVNPVFLPPVSSFIFSMFSSQFSKNKACQICSVIIALVLSLW